MRKTINIITVLTVIVAVINILTGMSEKLGISETANAWIEFLGLAIVAVMNVFSNFQSGIEVKELRKANESFTKK